MKGIMNSLDMAFANYFAAVEKDVLSSCDILKVDKGENKINFNY